MNADLAECLYLIYQSHASMMKVLLVGGTGSIFEPVFFFLLFYYSFDLGRTRRYVIAAAPIIRITSLCSR